MTTAEMNNYRLTSMEEPGDERMAQIMREVAEEARNGRKEIAEKVALGISVAVARAKEQVAETLNRVRHGV